MVVVQPEQEIDFYGGDMKQAPPEIESEARQGAFAGSKPPSGFSTPFKVYTNVQQRDKSTKRGSARDETSPKDQIQQRIL